MLMALNKNAIANMQQLQMQKKKSIINKKSDVT